MSKCQFESSEGIHNSDPGPATSGTVRLLLEIVGTIIERRSLVGNPVGPSQYLLRVDVLKAYTLVPACDGTSHEVH